MQRTGAVGKPAGVLRASSLNKWSKVCEQWKLRANTSEFITQIQLYGTSNNIPALMMSSREPNMQKG